MSAKTVAQHERVRVYTLTPGDILVGRHTGELFEIINVAYQRDMVRLSMIDGRHYTLERERMVSVDRSALIECDRCRGTGVYAWGGTVNGKPVHTGECFRCGGKGEQDAHDRKRNHNYDRYGIRL